MKNAIEIKNISKEYVLTEGYQPNTLRDLLSDLPSNIIKDKRSKKFWALKDINLNIKEGEIYGIIGKNGAGKSTLLKILSRIVPPTTGEVKIFGKVTSMLEVGTGFHQELSGKENVYLNGAILGMNRSEINKKYKDIVEFSEIEKFIDVPVKRYSSGMQVRLAFSVAAHLNSEILLIDEVLAVGDLSFQRKSLKKMHEITKDQGRTVIFVSHNISAVENLCHKVALLENGKLIGSGETGKIISEYVSNYTSEEPPERLDLSQKNVDSKIQITDFWIENKYKKSIKNPKTGEECYFVFKYKKSASSKLKDVDFGFTVKSISEQPLILNYSSQSGKMFDSLNKTGKFIFKIKKMPLTLGRYRLGFRITINGKEDNYLQNAVEFDIHQGEFYTPGIITNQTHSPFYLDGEWQNE